jgi:hypothetical protein
MSTAGGFTAPGDGERRLCTEATSARPEAYPVAVRRFCSGPVNRSLPLQVDHKRVPSSEISKRQNGTPQDALISRLCRRS